MPEEGIESLSIARAERDHGLLQSYWKPRLADHLVIMSAVALLTLLALIINRLRAIRYPVW